ncbi:MAG: transposase [Hormoscilla sp. GUM202]|nr:transposase [Hormoscilla sp. GUM202]
MCILDRVEEILNELRPVFSRQAAFEWFVLLIWGVLLCSQPPAVTSYLNAVGLSEHYYHQALHWFHSQAWSVVKLSQAWAQWLRQHKDVHPRRGKPVYVGDGIKVSKEGRKMPAVKQLHQESDNTNKPDWIRGHYFGCLCLLLGAADALFAVPIVLRIQDGLQQHEVQTITLVDRMAALCVRLATEGSYVVLDAFFAAGNLIAKFRENQLHLISRVRINTVGKHPLPRGRGKPRIWGERIKLRTLFASTSEFISSTVRLYGKQVTVSYHTIEDSPQHLVRFVLTVLPCGKPMILLSTDITLSGSEIIEAYGWRFKIEVTFRTLIQLLWGFSYRFWMKSLPPTPQWPKNLIIDQFPVKERPIINRKMAARERFVNLNAIGLGILQVLSLEMSVDIWQGFPRWFRTLPKHGYPTEQIVRLTLQDRAVPILAKCRPCLLLNEFLALRPRRDAKPLTERIVC